MARRVFAIATWTSAALLSFLLVLAFASIWINPRDHHLSLNRHFHIGVDSRGWDIRLFFFNDDAYGPYRGSIIGFVDAQGNIYPPLLAEAGFDASGVYYRYFRWSHGTLWTFAILIWYPIALFALLPLAWWIRRCCIENHKPKAPA